MQNKLNKVWGKILASVLVVALTAGNLMLIGSSMISYAEANLENQDEKTAHVNVEFGAYLESEGNKVHSLVCDAETKEKLYIHLNVKEAGYLKSGKIEIVDANYKVTGEIEESDIISNIKENIFELKQINSGTEALLEIPIALEIGEEFNIDNINKNCKVKLTGTYVTTEGEEVAIEKDVTLNIAWTSETQIKATSEVVTYKKYATSAERGIIVQEKITVEKEKGALPIKSTKIELMAPSFINESPEAVRVNSRRTEMTNGKTYDEVAITSSYDSTTGIVNIEVNNEEENKIVSAKQGGKDEYIVTYEYGDDAYKYDEGKTELRRNAKVTAVTYSHGENNTAEKTIEGTDTLTQEIGNIINGEIEIKEEINKAKIYANHNSNNREYETEYTVKEVIGTSKASITENIVAESEEEVFVTETEEKSLVVGNVDYTYYKSTKIATKNFNTVLGTGGSITIEDETEVIGTIDASMEAEDGYYVLTYSSKPENIKITTSKPVTEGDLILEHEKAIKADLAYSKEDAKGFREIKLTKQIGQTIDEAKQTIEGRQTLTEAVSHLNLISNKESINEKEETIELRLEFGNDEENSILYSEPTVKIALPKFIDIENVEKINAEVLFDEELEVGEKTIVSNETGEKVIQIKLTGTQTKFNTIPNANGATLVVGASILCKEAGEGEFVAEVEGNTASVCVVSYLETEESEDQDIQIGLEESPDTSTETEENPDTSTETEEPEKPRINVSMRSPMENVDLEEEAEISYIIDVNNISEYLSLEDEPIKNIIVKNFLPEELIFNEATMKKYNSETNEYEEIKDSATYDAKNRVVNWNVGDMLYEPSVQLVLRATINKLDEGVYNKEISNTVIASYEGMDNISSNTVKLNVVKNKINITKLTENILNSNKPKDSIKLILRVENVGKVKDDIKIVVNLPEGLKPISIKFGKNEDLIDRSNNSREIELEKVALAPEEKYLCEISAVIDEVDNNYKEQYKILTPKATINDQEISWTIKVENPNYVSSTPDMPNKPDIPDTPDTPDTPNKPDGSEQPKTYSITGNAWLDENENGVREEGEKKLKDIKVSIIGKDILKETKTDDRGMYSFEGLQKGSYQIIFDYNGEKYKVTQYRKTGEIEINSSAIATAKGEAITDVVKIVDKDIVNINLGLVKIPEFDMSLTKKVSRIIIQNKEGTKEYTYDTDLAKADINAKYLSGSVVLVEYKITIKNEGELAGRVKRIVDYMPKDMIFSTDVNKTWVQDSDGNLYNSELKDIDIEPGETKEITLILKKKMTEKNTGIINNTAEIVQTENRENIKDKDSTPNNKVQGEDDISSANVLLGVKTGAEVVYVTLAIVILIILATGMYLINKKVLKS